MTNALATLAHAAKAVAAFIVPGAVLIGSAVTDASDGGTTITTAEWVTALVACLVTSGAVYAIPNKTPAPVAPVEAYVDPEDPEDGAL